MSKEKLKYDYNSIKRVLKAIASFNCFKGLYFLLAGFILVSPLMAALLQSYSSIYMIIFAVFLFFGILELISGYLIFDKNYSGIGLTKFLSVLYCMVLILAILSLVFIYPFLTSSSFSENLEIILLLYYIPFFIITVLSLFSYRILDINEKITQRVMRR